MTAPVSNGAAQEAVTTKELRGTVATLARRKGMAVLDLHATNPGQPSRPELELIPPAGPTIYVYVRAAGSKKPLTDKQQEWVEFLTVAGVREVLVVTPETLDVLWGLLEERADA